MRSAVDHQAVWQSLSGTVCAIHRRAVIGSAPGTSTRARMRPEFMCAAAPSARATRSRSAADGAGGGAGLPPVSASMLRNGDEDSASEVRARTSRSVMPRGASAIWMAPAEP